MGHINMIATMLAVTIFAAMMSLSQVHSISLPATFIDCTSEIIDEDIKYAATNGHLAQELAMNGTMHMFADNDASAKWMFYKGELNFDVQTYSTQNLSDVRRIVFDITYKLNDKTMCLRLTL